MGHVKPQTFINVPKKKTQTNSPPLTPLVLLTIELKTKPYPERERVNPPFKRTNGARVRFLFEKQEWDLIRIV